VILGRFDGLELEVGIRRAQRALERPEQDLEAGRA